MPGLDTNDDGSGCFAWSMRKEARTCTSSTWVDSCRTCSHVVVDTSMRAGRTCRKKCTYTCARAHAYLEPCDLVLMPGDHFISLRLEPRNDTLQPCDITLEARDALLLL